MPKLVLIPKPLVFDGAYSLSEAPSSPCIGYGMYTVGCWGFRLLGFGVFRGWAFRAAEAFGCRDSLFGVSGFRF